MIVDSNVIIYSLQAGYESLQSYLVSRVDELYVSAITKLEVVGFPKLNEVEKQQFEVFFNNITILSITDEVIAGAIRLRQQRKRSLGDSVIAATALLYSQQVLTHNTGDFADIPGVEIISMTSVL